MHVLDHFQKKLANYQMMVFTNMKVSKLKRNFKREILKYNPTLELRMVGTLMKSLRFGLATLGYYDESATV